MRPEVFKKWLRPIRLQRRLKIHLPEAARLRLHIVAKSQQWRMVELQRDERHLTLLLATRQKIAQDQVHYYYRVFLPVVVYVFSRAAASIPRAVAELHDGSTAESDHMVFSANFHDALLIPDPEFFNSNGFALHRRKLSMQRPWHERADFMLWRGATTGHGRFPRQSADLVAPDVLQRIRLCALLKTISGIDAKIHRVVHSSDPNGDHALLSEVGLLGSAVPEDIWLDHKFAFDIDGNANTWTNLFIRLLFGCCVLKVASPRNFRQWYYERLEPWVHYVPIDADLGNLVERIDWCRSHPAECCAIAGAGQALALSMTLETETGFAVGHINRRLGQGH